MRSIKFFSLEVALYLNKSTIRPCMEYCCLVWAGTPSCYLELLDKLQKRYVGALVPCLLPLVNQNVATLVFSIGITLVDVHVNWLKWFHFLLLKGGLLVILIDCMIFHS